MEKLFPLIIVIICIYFVINLFSKKKSTGGLENDKKRSEYRYKRKQFFMTRAEHEFYDALVIAVGNEYRIFSQVHLATLLDNKIAGQDWRAAQAHINRKSVDFVLCDKAYLSPKLAIELDDKTHEHPDRQERDGEVERILKDAGMPLLRLENRGNFNPAELAQRISEVIKAR